MNERLQWQGVYLLAVVVLVASLVPGSGAAIRGPLGVVGIDKWVHGIAYATLAGAVTVADGRASVGVGAAVAYGVLVELLQLGVPYRTGSALDVLANLTGAVLGAMLVVAATNASRRYEAWASTRSTREK